MIDERDDGAHDVSVLTDDRAPSGRRRVLPVQALLRRLPVHARAGAGVEDRLPAADAAIARDPGARQGKVQRGARAAAHAPTCRARWRRRSRRLVNADRQRRVRPGRSWRRRPASPRDRLLPSYARVRFSKWFRDAARRGRARRRPRATASRSFPTCLVEYQEPAIGEAMVGVCERNGIACSCPKVRCAAGCPGSTPATSTSSSEHARANVAALARRRCAPVHDVVVPQPTCAYVLKKEYPDFLGTDDARLVAEHTFDVVRVPDARGTARSRSTPTFDGHHLRHDHLARRVPLPRAADRARRARSSWRSPAPKVTMVERCSAIDGTWGLRAENVEMARKIAKPLMEAVARVRHRARRRRLPPREHRDPRGHRRSLRSHPVQVLARAYGLDDES